VLDLLIPSGRSRLTDTAAVVVDEFDAWSDGTALRPQAAFS
jgi:hypothetical protein